MVKRGLVKELQWRGLIHDFTPGVEKLLDTEMVTAYIGFDPTADSLHIGNLIPVLLLKHLQNFGHKPLVLIGGATGMVGDPSGKTKERKLLDKETIDYNLSCQKKQLQCFLDFDNKINKAEIVNNFDWFKGYNFLDFIRDIGKHITINYMLSKDSVKTRLDTGMSFTEFSYQLIQGYDFYYLFKNKNCKLQMGGSDQWGNIVTGTELIRKKTKMEAYALTAPLVKRADGGKFGKSEGENIWLNVNKTSPYKFYQYWLNVSDKEAENFIKMFTFLSKKEIEELISQHNRQKHLRILQKKLAEDITQRVHSKKDLNMAISASEILFGKATTKTLKQLDEQTFLSVFEGVPKYNLNKTLLDDKILAIDILITHTDIFPSKGEFRRLIKNNAVSINKQKITDANFTFKKSDLIDQKFILLQKGKKNYYLLVF